MATLEELFNEKKEKGVSLNTLFKEEKKGVPLNKLFKEKKDVLEGSVIDGGKLLEKDKDKFFDKFDGFWEGYKDQVIKKTYGGAARDIAQGTIDFVNYVGSKIPGVENKLIDTTFGKIEEPEYFGGSFTRDVLGFFAGFKGVDKISNLTKIPKAKNKLLRSAQILTKGGVAEQVAFSPYEQRLSNLVESYPRFQNPVTNYLKAVGTDSENVARAKMFTEGALLGIPFELIANVAKGADKVKVDAGAKLKAEDTFKNIKVFSRENQDRIYEAKNKQKVLDDIAKEQFEKAKVVKERLGDKARSLEGFDVPTEISRPALKKKVTDPVEKASLELLKEGKVERNPYLKLNEQISDLISTGRVSTDEWLKILKKNKVNEKDFARFYSYNASDAGRTLQSLSAIQRQLNNIFNTPGAKKEYRKLLAENDLLDTQSGFWRRLDNIRRGAMVTQLATAVRNFESQVTRGGLNVMQKGLDRGMQNIVKAVNPNAKILNLADPLETLKGFGNVFRQANIFNGFKYAKRLKKDTDKLLSSFPKEQDRLFLRFSNDVVNKGLKESLKGSPLDKVEGAVQLLNIVNKTQEFITRRAIFQSSLAERIARNKDIYNGKTLKRLIEDNQTLGIRKEDIAGAVDDALEITFAKNFDGNAGGYEKFANNFINFVNSIPFTTSLVIPFPRFLMNSVKFHIDFSPLGILNFLSKGERQALAKGDTSKLSRIVLGTGLLSLGYWLRSQPYAGEKWYEFKVGDETIDVRALNPFAAYLYVGDLVKRYQDGTLRNVGLKDFAGAFLGVRAGTGLYLVDKLLDAVSGENPKYNTSDVAKEAAVKALSGFAVPLQTFRDFAGSIYPEMSVVRDTSEEPLLGEFKKRLPIPTDYPPLLSATSIEFNEQGVPVARVLKREKPAIRQLTGLTFQAPKNSAEKELDRLQILPGEVFRRTKIPELDAAIKQELAPRIALGLSALVESSGYQSVNDQIKVVLLKRALTKFKKESFDAVKNNKDLAPYLLRYEIEKMGKDDRRYLDSILGKQFLKDLTNSFIK